MPVFAPDLASPLWFGGLGAVALLAAGLWISQVRRLESALRLPPMHPTVPGSADLAAPSP